MAKKTQKQEAPQPATEAATPPKAPAKKRTTKAAAAEAPTAPAASKPRRKEPATANAVPASDSPMLVQVAAGEPDPMPGDDAAWPELSDGVASADLWSLVHCTCYNPHNLLGVHQGNFRGRPGLVVRVWHPTAEAVEVIAKGTGETFQMRKLPVPGIFGLFLADRKFPFRYSIRLRFGYRCELVTDDPYSFLPTLGELDTYLLGEGNHLNAYRKLGAQVMEMDGVKGVAFALWAPSARRVSLIGDFNEWDGRLHPMRSMGASGVWELFIPGVGPGSAYKFEILTHDGHMRFKADPYAFSFDLRPSTDSRVVDRFSYRWNDADYMAKLPGRRPLEEPMAVYEVHLGSWMRVPEEGNRWLTYRELADRLVPHVKRYGFTHVELLPVMEHPFDGSWGYQVTGYFAPTSRFGSPDDFRYFVDEMHRAGIGVLLDWVPAHFPRDDWALRWFDGTALYEHEDPRRGEHKDWGTLIFNYGRPQVKNFLLANALYWLDEFHVDGLRVDAVASMLYLDYSRAAGEWVPNQFGGRENLEAIAFLRQLNEVVHRDYPGRFTVAEESTAFPGVSRPLYMGGLGFTFKWNMGWMNDTLRYFATDPIYRKYHQNDLTFALVYQYTENFVLPLSHDEVVHGKGSLLAKMAGDTWQKFANLRLLYSYMYAHPGKKLLFMGAEFGQGAEWSEARSLDWHLPSDPMHRGMERCMEALGQVYLNNREFWIFDNDPIGFRWIDFSDNESSVVSFIRQGPEGHVVCAFNFTPMPRYGYRLGVPSAGTYHEIYNSDSADYGGANLGNYGQAWTQPVPMHGQRNSLHINIPPLGAVFLKYEGL